MANLKDWYDDIVKVVDEQKIRLGKKTQKKYKVDSLLRVAKRVAEFAEDCEECRGFQGEINTLASRLGNVEEFSKEERKEYSRTRKKLTEHLQKKHKLVPEGYYVGVGVALGISIGVAIGTAIQVIGAGIGIGLALGAAIGSSLDAQAKKDGKVI
ncbi:MAG: hypothetical protein WBG01_02815 [Bacteroidota bacterium]